jgi:hypothetical protein
MPDRRSVVRIQTGVRMEKRILQVLKALANSLDMTLGDLLEGIVLHAFEGKAPFGPGTLEKIRTLRQVYDLDLGAADSHQLTEPPTSPSRRPASRKANPRHR